MGPIGPIGPIGPAILFAALFPAYSSLVMMKIGFWWKS